MFLLLCQARTDKEGRFERYQLLQDSRTADIREVELDDWVRLLSEG
jgi:hypothetical protein